jgi:glycerol transport system ATP-binding protein
MNFLPAQAVRGGVLVNEQPLAFQEDRRLPEGPVKLGIRPEYLRLGQAGDGRSLPARVSRVQDIGTYFLLTCELGGHTLKSRLGAEAAPPAEGDTVHLRLLDAHTCFYRDEQLVEATA